MPDPYEELARLYAEYLDERKKDENKDLGAYPDPIDEHTRQVKARLPEFDEDSSGGVITTAVEWWNTRGEPLPRGRGRFELLHYLLRRVDGIVESHTPQRFCTAKGTLTLGPPWWNLYRRVRAAEAKHWAHEYQFTPQRPPLMNIRLLRGEIPRRVASGRFHTRMRFLLASDNGPALRIGLCVLGDQGQAKFTPTVVVDESQRMYGFKSTCVADLPDREGSVAEELKECVDWARRNQIHILCFPEFSIDSAGLEVIRNEVLADPGSLCLAIPGSFHVEMEGTIGRVNRAPIWLVEQDEREGNTVTRLCDDGWFDKGDPFTLDAADAHGALDPIPQDAQSFREHIDLGTTLTVIDTVVGRVGIAICKDLLGTDISERYGAAIDHLVVLSLSPKGGGTFWSAGDMVSRRERIAVYYVNSCQWVPTDDSTLDLAYACFPERRYLENVAYVRRVPLINPSEQGRPKSWRPATQKALPADRRVIISIPLPSTVING
jgi:hypothetical protein